MEKTDQRTTYAYIIRSPDDNSPATCAKCNQLLELDKFYYHSTRSDGFLRFRPACKNCRRKGPRTQWSRPVHAEIIESGVQRCKFCGETKPLTEFYANGCFKDGVLKYRSRCKACVLEKSKENHPNVYKNKAKIRGSSARNYIVNILHHASQRKKGEYNLDLPFLMELYEKQNGNCAISGRKMTYITGKGRIATNISLDRIDNTKGYIKGNVHLVCLCVNVMKSTMTTEELLFWCSDILEFNNGKNSNLAAI